MNKESIVDEDLEILAQIREMDSDPYITGRYNTLFSDRIVTFNRRELKACREHIIWQMKDKPVGTVMIFQNYRGEIIEIVKVGKRIFDTVEHLGNRQMRIQRLNPSLVLSAFFVGEYDLDSMKLSEALIEDHSLRTVTTIKRFTVKDEDSTVHIGYRYSQTDPDGTVTSGQQIF